MCVCVCVCVCETLSPPCEYHTWPRVLAATRALATTNHNQLDSKTDVKSLFSLSTLCADFCKFWLQMDLQVKNFDFSVKNIPIPSKYAYKKRLIQKAESLIRRMRWKAKNAWKNVWYTRPGGGRKRTTPRQGSSECSSRQNFNLDPPPIWTTRVVQNSDFYMRDHPLKRVK